MDIQTAKQYGIILLIIVGVVGLGLLAINQFITWKYKVQFLAGPCKLCVDTAPEWKECYDNYLTKRVDTNTTNQLQNKTLKINWNDYASS